MKTSTPETLGWGVTTDEGIEIWDADPVFLGDTVTFKDHLKLLFYPKKWFLYRFIQKHFRAQKKQYGHTDHRFEPYRILDVGCGMGATVIDLKKMFGRSVDVIGIDVVKMQIELGNKKLKSHGVSARLDWYDGVTLPFENQSFDAIYTSDVLGHVQDVEPWLKELSRVLKPGGVLAMFSESALGPHAYVRQYMLRRGLNTDPHAQYHISLFQKIELKTKLQDAGFEVQKMYSSFWLKFLCHPEELYPALQKSEKFSILKTLNLLLYRLKKKTHPYYAALAELYGLIEMYILGRFVQAQGYVILAKKKE